MTCKVTFDELESALQWTSSGIDVDAAAYVDLETGTIYWRGDEGIDEDEDLPEDLLDPDRYVRVPSKRDLDLGSRMARAFAWERLSEDDADRVEGYFHRSGAYRRFTALLGQCGQLDAWHAYEAERTKAALLDWAGDHDIEVVGG